MRFAIYQDNGGHFHWSILGDEGLQLAVSAGSFATRADARRAAAEVHKGASSAAGPEARASAAQVMQLRVGSIPYSSRPAARATALGAPQITVSRQGVR